ncbi:hypothetical protein [Christensenella timonensis]|uniref:hypothetical protein n=1 Tax=Christensenella timonensis TaxID=1816678 RepID=UPI00082C17CF|nr:hypothetical protein [Christensenella timonensis]
MKKVLIVVMCVVLACAFTGCAGVPVKQYVALQEEYESLQMDYDSVVAERDALQEELDAVTALPSPDTEPDTPVSPAGSSTEANQVLMDQDGIKITYTGVNYDGWSGPEIKLSIENSSAQDVTIQVRDMSVNGIMLSGIMSADVTAGKKAVDAITIASWDMEEKGITTLETAEFAFNVFSTETWDDIFVSDKISLSF